MYFHTNNAEAMAKLLEQAAQGRAPDVTQIDTYILPRYLPYLQPIDDLVKAAGIDMKDFFPFAEKIVRGKDGKVYGIQFTTDVRVLFYRKDLISNPQKRGMMFSNC
jgi:multiple sugar transport system substrate-binding protein